MAITISNVFFNSVEDLFDEYSSTVIFRETKEVLAPLKKPYESDNPSDWDDAVSGAITTLQMGISMYAITWITSSLLPALYKRASLAFAYITFGSFVKRLKSANLGGKTMRKGLGVVSDMFEKRQKNTEIAIGMMNHQDSMMMDKMKIANHTKRSFDSSIVGGRSQNQLNSIEIMTTKTKTGTWTSSHEDKKLYERATGQKLKVTWGKLYKKLNSFQEFAKNAEDEILSKAQVEFDTWISNGLKKVQ